MGVGDCRVVAWMIAVWVPLKTFIGSVCVFECVVSCHCLLLNENRSGSRVCCVGTSFVLLSEFCPMAGVSKVLATTSVRP